MFCVPILNNMVFWKHFLRGVDSGALYTVKYDSWDTYLSL